MLWEGQMKISCYRNQSGQAAIVICFSFITLFLLLALTINVGMYIHDKINLQNAADAGAYAGASEQARLLQEIGYANYDFRQLYKRFIFDYRYRFSIDNDRDPIISPSVCVTFPFCDCVVRQGEVDQAVTCGTKAERESEMVVGTHGQTGLVHQMPWNVSEPYDCAGQTALNKKQAEDLRDYYEEAFRDLHNQKIRKLVNTINMKNGRVDQIAKATIKANLSWGNQKTEIKFPRPKELASDPPLNLTGPYLSLIQRMPSVDYKIYYTIWSGPISKPWCFYKGKPNCTVYTCKRHHAAGVVNMHLDGIWFVKNPELTTLFMTHLKRDKTEFAFPFKFFGDAPEMNAVSAAKPFGASLGWPDPYSEETIVKELYVRDTKSPYPNLFLQDHGASINPSYIDFMEAFYWFDRPEYQSLIPDPGLKYMPIPLVATVKKLNNLHFVFDAESFVGMNNEHGRARFEIAWPFDDSKGIPGRSGYSVKFIAIRDIGRRYKASVNDLPEKDSVDH